MGFIAIVLQERLVPGNSFKQLIYFLLYCKPLLLYVESLFQAHHFSTWCQVRNDLPVECGLFGTVWTTLVVNLDYPEWHFDPQDCGLTAIIYFGEFYGGEFLIGSPFNLKIEVRNLDIILVNSSAVYHRSLPFTGSKVVLGMYSTKYKLTSIK